MNSKSTFLPCIYKLVLGILVYLINFPLQADIVSTSGYDGILIRLQAGVGYSELLEDYSIEDEKYYGTGYFAATQLGWFINEQYALHLGGSTFLANSVQGPEIMNRTTDNIGKSKHDYMFTTIDFGFSWYSIYPAFYISPELHLIQVGTRTSTQRISMADGTSQNTEEKVTYNTRLGYSITVGKDIWFGENFGTGVFLRAHRDHILLEKSEFQVTQEPSGSITTNTESDLDRVSASNTLLVFGINIIIN